METRRQTEGDPLSRLILTIDLAQTRFLDIVIEEDEGCYFLLEEIE